MNRRPFATLAFALSVAACSFSATESMADTPSLLKVFGRTSAATAPEGKLELSEEDGPWLILAATFVGENSRDRAERLAREIRQDMKLPAFIYREKFDFTGRLNSSSASSRHMRYANQYEYEAYAVLVGEYDSVENKQINADLARVKTAKPKVYSDPEEVAAATDMSTPVKTVKAISRKLLKLRDDKESGPMAAAFVTRNPMLPEDYFQSPQVDSFVKQINEGLEHSLLDCKGKYTVCVATFEGLSTIVDGRKEKKFAESTERMAKFARDAAKMTAELRKQGVEAYQFHDRYRSIVTVGSFEQLGRELPDGQFEYASDIRATVSEYSAFNARKARVIPGKNAVAANHAAMIPFDVKPTPIAVPKVSKRSLYGTKLGMN
tara:strand:- start:118124 stop:119257 length:1134 start_codon:yes stop_codon:yes gene_type:complete